VAGIVGEVMVSHVDGTGEYQHFVREGEAWSGCAWPRPARPSGPLSSCWHTAHHLLAAPALVTGDALAMAEAGDQLGAQKTAVLLVTRPTWPRSAYTVRRQGGRGHHALLHEPDSSDGHVADALIELLRPNGRPLAGRQFLVLLPQWLV
jgi:hypothetical protein